MHPAASADQQVRACVGRQATFQRGGDAVDADVALRAQDDGGTGRHRARDEQVAARLRLQAAAGGAGARGGARRACDAQVLARAQQQFAAALGQAGLADAQVPGRVRAQRAVGDGLAVQFGVRAGLQRDVLLARDRAVGLQLAAGLRLQQSACLQRACAAQRHGAAALHLERTRIGQDRAVHRQVLVDPQRRRLPGHQRARQGGAVGLHIDRAIGLQARVRAGGQRAACL